jgi:hypothetical protein
MISPSHVCTSNPDKAKPFLAINAEPMIPHDGGHTMQHAPSFHSATPGRLAWQRCLHLLQQSAEQQCKSGKMASLFPLLFPLFEMEVVAFN